MKPTFRKFEDADRRSVQSVIFQILREYDLPADHAGTDQDLSDIKAHYFTEGGYFEVCEGDGMVIGTWGLKRTSPDLLELKKMYLHKKYRRQGIGRKMLERAIQKARELGAKSIELETSSVLKEAISLYESFGFKVLERSPSSGRCNQVFELKL